MHCIALHQMNRHWEGNQSHAQSLCCRKLWPWLLWHWSIVSPLWEYQHPEEVRSAIRNIIWEPGLISHQQEMSNVLLGVGENWKNACLLFCESVRYESIFWRFMAEGSGKDLINSWFRDLICLNNLTDKDRKIECKNNKIRNHIEDWAILFEKLWIALPEGHKWADSLRHLRVSKSKETKDLSKSLTDFIQRILLLVEKQHDILLTHFRNLSSTLTESCYRWKISFLHNPITKESKYEIIDVLIWFQKNIFMINNLSDLSVIMEYKFIQWTFYAIAHLWIARNHPSPRPSSVYSHRLYSSPCLCHSSTWQSSGWVILLMPSWTRIPRD
jgi:hypothetical protein